MKPIRILLTGHNVNDGLVYQRGHIPLRGLDPGRYHVTCKNFDDLGHSDFFYSDLVIMIHGWTMMAAHIAERARHHYGLPVIADIDDLMHDLPTDHPEHVYSENNQVARIIQACSQLVVSTNYLKYAYGHLNKHVTVIENALDSRLYRAYKPNHEKLYKTGFTLGFTGGQTHRPDIYATWLAAVDTFLGKYPDSRLYAHVNCPDSLKRKYGTQVTYDSAVIPFLDYPAVSAAYPVDLMLVGLAQHPFNDAKSDLKLLEMAPHEIPVLASPRSEFIRHESKKIMLFAEDNSDSYHGWLHQMEWAYANREKLREMAIRSRHYVMECRTEIHATRAWEQVIDSVIARLAPVDAGADAQEQSLAEAEVPLAVVSPWRKDSPVAPAAAVSQTAQDLPSE